jgi:hypothetical protein
MKGTAWAIGLALVCCLAVPAQALERGLYLVEGSNDYYFVDEFGSRHVVQNYDTLRPKWFSDMPVIKTTLSAIDSLPTGDIITETVGPGMVVKKTTTTTVGSGSLSRGVYEVDGQHYFVDEYGTRHAIQGFDKVQSRWFSGLPVQQTRVDLINSLPLGDAITETVGPDMVVRKKTTTTTVDDADGVRSTTTKTEESTQVR